MMLTAVSDTPTAAESLGLGAMEYLMKPIELGELQLAIERVLHRRNVALEQRNVERIINHEVERRVTQLHHATPHACDLSHESLVRVVTQCEARDAWFTGMSLRVAGLAGDLARSLDLEPEDCDRIGLAGRLHDIGRVALRESVLAKPATLSLEEFEHVKEHVARGLAILEPAGLHQSVYDTVRDHHEHWDGSGYPAGKSGKAISLGGRILCATDAFVALTSPRPYRQAATPREASSILSRLAGSVLDPVVAERLLRIVAGRHHTA
jgi:putative nucleotidyltransferase with HDIG domain